MFVYIVLYMGLYSLNSTYAHNVRTHFQAETPDQISFNIKDQIYECLMGTRKF